MELIVGHVYEARKRAQYMLWPSTVWNDRMILHIGGGQVQYDSPTVRHGRGYPRVPIEQFRKWAGRDVTEETPKGDWRPAGRGAEGASAMRPDKSELKYL